MARRGASKLVWEDVKVSHLPSPANHHPTMVPQSLLEIVDSNLVRAQRDNDLIYHQDVPPASSLPVIQPAAMVESGAPQGLLEPKKILGSDNLIFWNLISWGAQTAIGRCGSPCTPILRSNSPQKSTMIDGTQRSRNTSKIEHRN
jgi:hypothetical protein